MTDFLNLKPSKKHVVCPKHGTHENYINSNIEGHEGHWCMLCFLESLGPSLPTVDCQNDKPTTPPPLKLKRSGGYQPLTHSGKTNPPPSNP